MTGTVHEAPRSGAPVARPGRRMPRHALAVAASLACAALALGLGACESPDPALARGDRLWADSNYTGALAEYRLALRQSGGDEAILARVAHAYLQTGQLSRAREAYDQLLGRHPERADQAVYDYLHFARRAAERGDRYGMAGAVEAAQALRPELPLPDLAAALGRYYSDIGDAERALVYYERALTLQSPDSAVRLLYELGLLFESLGGCEEAIGYFEAYGRQAPEGDRANEARWHMGSCAFELARRAHQEGRPGDALEHVTLVLDLGVPENIQDQAWFEQGEILFVMGRFDEALVAYRKVLELNPARTGQLVERAQRRIDQIRFGS